MNETKIMKLDNLTDEQLMLEFQENDNRKAYTILVNRFKDKLKSFLWSFTKDDATSEDICQDTFLKVYIKKGSYKEVAKFSTWLYTIASNLAKTHLRKIKRRQTYSVSQLSKEDREFVIESPDQGIDDREVNKVDINMLTDSMQLLDIEFRNILLMRDIQELSYEDISRILEIPLGTVKSRINRGRIKLRDILKKNGVRLY